MRYLLPLIDSYLVRRYGRFLVDVTVNGQVLTVHCPNSGSMAGLLDPGNPVRISGPHAGDRRYPFTLEQIRITRPDGRKIWVGVNTMIPNLIINEALKNQRLPGLEDYPIIRKEVKLGTHSRIDFRLEADSVPPCWIEVKNVSLVLSDPCQKSSINAGNIAAFPDAVTVRGAKHLRDLKSRLRLGERGMMIYVIQRSDSEMFAPAECNDPNYAKELRRAVAAGVEVLAIRVYVSKSGIWLRNRIDALI